MGLTRYTIYKYCKTAKGWRYCKPAYAANRKIKPHVVVVDGKEETHPEGAYYLNVDGAWEKAGTSAAEALEAQSKRLARQRYEKETGEKLPEPEGKGVLLRDAIDAYLSELELSVAGKSRQPKTLAAARQTLREFAERGQVRHLNGVSASHIAKHMAWVIQNSPTHSAKTARNKFIQKPVSTYTPQELARFFSACDVRETAIFQTLNRAGLREQELSTLRRQDCKLEGPAPCIKVTERQEYGFVPKWYAIRDVSIDPELASILKRWLSTHEDALVFPTPKGQVDGHILRLCQRVARRAGMDPDNFWLHKFRSSYATHCLRRGMDLETLRDQLGHRDTESLRRYIQALKDEQRAVKVAEVFVVRPEDAMTPENAATASGVM